MKKPTIFVLLSIWLSIATITIVFAVVTYPNNFFASTAAKEAYIKEKFGERLRASSPGWTGLSWDECDFQNTRFKVSATKNGSIYFALCHDANNRQCVVELRKDWQRIAIYNPNALNPKDRWSYTGPTFTEADIGMASAPDGSIISRFDYVYDHLGRPTSVTTLQGKTTYGYDATGQLTSVSLPGGRTITYQYDAAGNRVSVTDNNVTTSYTTNYLNDEYTQVGSTHDTYDKNGNLKSQTDSSGTTTYSYSLLGQLIGVVSPQGTWSYQYDALGNRIASTQNGQKTQYLIDPTGIGNVVGEFDGSGNLVAHYTQGLGLTSRVDSSGAAAYYNFDLTGNTTELTGAGGVVLNTYSYLPFGQPLGATANTLNPFTYVGQLGVSTDGSGLYFMRHRWYEVSAGRFTQPDPVGLGGAERYRYVNNTPIATVDSTGLAGDPPLIERIPGQEDAPPVLYKESEQELHAETDRFLNQASAKQQQWESLPSTIPYGCEVKYDTFYDSNWRLQQFYQVWLC